MSTSMFCVLKILSPAFAINDVLGLANPAISGSRSAQCCLWRISWLTASPSTSWAWQLTSKPDSQPGSLAMARNVTLRGGNRIGYCVIDTEAVNALRLPNIHMLKHVNVNKETSLLRIIKYTGERDMRSYLHHLFMFSSVEILSQKVHESTECFLPYSLHLDIAWHNNVASAYKLLCTMIDFSNVTNA